MVNCNLTYTKEIREIPMPCILTVSVLLNGPRACVQSVSMIQGIFSSASDRVDSFMGVALPPECDSRIHVSTFSLWQIYNCYISIQMISNHFR